MPKDPRWETGRTTSRRTDRSRTVSAACARVRAMTNKPRTGTALVTVIAREFAAVNAVDERLTDTFAYTGPMRDSITEEGICRTLLLQISGAVDEESSQSLPPAPPLDISGLGEDQARVRIAASSQDDASAAMDVVSSVLTRVDDPVFSANGVEVVFTVARR